jgi:hypothetical protein
LRQPPRCTWIHSEQRGVEHVLDESVLGELAADHDTETLDVIAKRAPRGPWRREVNRTEQIIFCMESMCVSAFLALD